MTTVTFRKSLLFLLLVLWAVLLKSLALFFPQFYHFPVGLFSFTIFKGIVSKNLFVLKQESTDPYPIDECIALPLYYTLFRDRVVTQLNVPCGTEQDKWIQSGAALFLKNM